MSGHSDPSSIPDLRTRGRLRVRVLLLRGGVIHYMQLTTDLPLPIPSATYPPLSNQCSRTSSTR